MPRMIAIGLMWAAPVLLTLVAFGVSRLAGGHGGRSAVIRGEVRVALVLFVLVHAGFYLGPWLLTSDRRTLGLWLTVPVALVSSFLVVATMSRLRMFDRSPVRPPLAIRLVPWMLGVGYWGPVAGLLWSR